MCLLCFVQGCFGIILGIVNPRDVAPLIGLLVGYAVSHRDEHLHAIILLTKPSCSFSCKLPTVLSVSLDPPLVLARR